MKCHITTKFGTTIKIENFSKVEFYRGGDISLKDNEDGTIQSLNAGHIAHGTVINSQDEDYRKLINNLYDLAFQIRYDCQDQILVRDKSSRMMDIIYKLYTY